jgi:hypothetical protein
MPSPPPLLVVLIFPNTVVLTLYYPTYDLSFALTRGTTVILSPHLYVHHRKTDLVLTHVFKN